MKKKDIVKAIEDIIEKYKNNTFDNKWRSCPMCILIKIHFKIEVEIYASRICPKCIHLNKCVECINQKTYPEEDNQEAYRIRITFWKEVLKVIDSLPIIAFKDENIGNEKYWGFIKKIDHKVYHYTKKESHG